MYLNLHTKHAYPAHGSTRFLDSQEPALVAFSARKKAAIITL